MQWVMNDAKGFPYWHEHSIYRLMTHYPLLDLLAERHSDKNKSDIYIAEISDTQSIELLRGLSRYNLIDVGTGVLDCPSVKKINKQKTKR